MKTNNPHVFDFVRSLLASFIPKQSLSPNEWNETHRQMEPGAAKSGRWRSFPFQVEPINSIADPSVRKETLQWSSQFTGKTAVITGIIGYLMDQRPTSILNVHPTELSASHFIRSRINPLISQTPCLASIIDSSKVRSGVRKGLGGQQILRKTFPGGWFLAGGSNSPAQLRAHSARVTVFDECDVFEAHKEGDVMLLARQRSATFPDSFSIAASTPTFKGLSRIEAEYELSDQRRWLCCCPHCKEWQELRWSSVVWEKLKDSAGKTLVHKTETAHLECQACNRSWTEEERIQAVSAGRWVPVRPEIKSHRGYRLNALNCLLPRPNGRTGWPHEFAERFLEARKIGTVGLQVFTNTILGESWEAEAQEPPEHAQLYERRELYLENENGIILPDGVLFLTAGVDVQQQPPRLESTIVGWGEGDESWTICHRIFYGDPTGREVWNELDAFIQKRWLHSSGHRLYPEIVLVDSGDQAAQVYDYVFRCGSRKVFATRGQRAYSPKFIARSQGQNARLYLIKTTAPKEALYSRLRLTEPGPGFCHFPSNESAGFDRQWFAQLCSEVMRTSYKLGRAEPYFEKKESHAKNEALDIFVLNMAARQLQDIMFDGIDYAAVKAWLESPPEHDIDRSPGNRRQEFQASALNGRKSLEEQKLIAARIVERLRKL